MDVGVFEVAALAAGALTFGIARAVDGAVTGGFTVDGTFFFAGCASAGLVGDASAGLVAGASAGAAGATLGDAADGAADGAGSAEGGFTATATASSDFSGVAGEGTG